MVSVFSCPWEDLSRLIGVALEEAQCDMTQDAVTKAREDNLYNTKVATWKAISNARIE